VSEGIAVSESENESDQPVFLDSATNAHRFGRQISFVDPVSGDEYFCSHMSAAAERYVNSNYRRVLELIVCWILLITLLPLFLFIALGVRVTTSGPVLFRQLRYGRGMVMFELIKFRSMYWTDESSLSVKQATRNDLRVTPLGRVLRCTSLDELPQLINVVKGEMSLIGPRPHAIQHDVYYRGLIPGYCSRFRVRPGLTGLAQVSGARGCTPQVEDMERRIQFDLLYLQNASLNLDFLILLRTLREVFRSQAAY
jgi:putative colanic acid biosynthesis UDP-glucose lipid carrier transferase